MSPASQPRRARKVVPKKKYVIPEMTDLNVDLISAAIKDPDSLSDADLKELDEIKNANPSISRNIERIRGFITL